MVMRQALVALAMLIVPATAWAQTQAVTRPAPFGPLSLGMNEAAVRAALPGAEWDEFRDADLQRATLRTRAPALELYGIRFRAHLAFAADAATVVRLTAEEQLSEFGCRDQHRAMVEAEMRARAPFTERVGWHSFYHDPDAPRGRLEGEEYISAPTTLVRSVSETLADPRAQYTSVILSYDGSAHGQRFYSAAGSGGSVTAHSITRADGSSICRVTMVASARTSSGRRISDQPGGAQLLAERLAAAERAPAPNYIDRPTGYDFARYYPSRALAQEISGNVRLNCLVLADGALDCLVHEEAPLDYEFGAAAMRIARAFRADVFDVAPGKHLSIGIRFLLPE